jgi:hypothetical protein
MIPLRKVPVTDPVATRTYDCGGRGTLEVRLGRPYCEEGDDWRCPIEVVGPMTSFRQEMFGIDPMQALLHGIYILATVVEISEEKKSGILNWFGDHERFGLPTAEANSQFSPGPPGPPA